ncbi:uncharacterized protein CEXT_176641 [Caerostris extrusa]|uniref:RanBP2-type domain-containing protein n=1 Tax=Caerostris extrusa TaxID=172846 RepID=A0AAV4Y545_CAEEX|nr:uncharacterized protein CEXT_176641 [Caerostris extrusa]
MATGNIDYSFPKRPQEFSGPFNLNYIDTVLETPYLVYSSESPSNIMDDNPCADEELPGQVLDTQNHNYPTATSSNDNGNSKNTFASSKEMDSPRVLADLMKMNKNDSQVMVQQEPQSSAISEHLNIRTHNVIPEELSIDIGADEDGTHSWRPNLTNSLSTDIFLTQPLFSKSPTTIALHPDEPDCSIPGNSIEEKLLDNVGRIRISDNPYLINNFHIDIKGHLCSQKAQMNIVKYEVMSGRRSITELTEAIQKLTYKLGEKKMFQNSQEIQKLSEENAQLRLECQCLSPLGEVDEKFYGASSTQNNQAEAHCPVINQCTNRSENIDIEYQDESNEWECPKCTFANHPAIQSCEMCHMTRPKKENPMFLSPMPETCYCHPENNREAS